MTRKRGSALLGTLWLIVVLGSITMGLQAEAMHLIKASRNRIALVHGAWAGAACESRIRADLSVVRSDSVTVPLLRILNILENSAFNVGSDAACRSEIEDLGAHLNVNTAAPSLLECVLGDRLASEVVRYRPLPSTEALQALAALHGGEIQSWFNVVGPNLFNINSAPIRLLACLPDVEGVGARIIEQARQHSQSFASTADFAQRLPLLQREALLLNSAHRLVAEPPALLLRIVGTYNQSAILHERRLQLQVRGSAVDVIGARIQ